MGCPTYDYPCIILLSVETMLQHLMGLLVRLLEIARPLKVRDQQRQIGKLQRHLALAAQLAQ